MSNEVAVKKEAGALAAVDFGELAGAGLENLTAADQKIPFLVALQGQSEAVTADGSKVKAGDLYNTVTSEAFDGKKGLVVIPAITERAFAEFKPNQQGFVCRRAIDDPIVLDAQKQHAALGLPFGKLFTSYDERGNPNGNQLIDTRYVYVVLCDIETSTLPIGYAIMAFKSTDTDEFKRYFGTTLANFVVPKKVAADGTVEEFQPTPLFCHPTRVTLELNKYKVGSAYNFRCEPANGTVRENFVPDLSDPRLVQAIKLYKLVKAGQVKADFGSAGKDSSSSDDTPF